jgi:hypothetical protein
MRAIAKQVLNLLQKGYENQKAFVVMAAVIILGLVVLLLLNVDWGAKRAEFKFLCTLNELDESKRRELKEYLRDQKIQSIEKQGHILVEEKALKQVEKELSIGEISKKNESAGFELFDAGTWIKGEKELQILEVRALIGQLESDISSFENISSAHVILDIAKERSFNKNPNKTKASVILTLKKACTLNRSILAAITYHLSSAVRGLEPQMIAISDTSGRLYQGFGRDISAELEDILLEEKIYSDCMTLLKKVVEENCFHITVKALNGKADIAVVLDKRYEAIKNEVHKQLKAIAPLATTTVDCLNFLRAPVKTESVVENKESWWIWGLSFLPITLFLIPLFLKKKEVIKPLPNISERIKSFDIDFLKRASAHQKPREIAILLSSLEMDLAEKIIGDLPVDMQRAVLHELSTMESLYDT